MGEEESSFTFNPACLVRNIVAVMFLIIMIMKISGAMDAENWVELEGDNVDSGDMMIGLYDLSDDESNGVELEEVTELYSDANQDEGTTYWGRFEWAGWLANIWFWLVMIGIGLISLGSLAFGMADELLDELEVDQDVGSDVARWAILKIGVAGTIAGAVLIGCLGWYIITPDYDDILIGEKADGDNIYLQDAPSLKDAEFVLSDGWYDMMWTMLWAGLYLGVMLIPAEKFNFTGIAPSATGVTHPGTQQPMVQQQYAQQPLGQQQQYAQQPLAQQPMGQQQQYAQQPLAQQHQYAQQPLAQQHQYAQQPLAQQPMAQQAAPTQMATKKCQHCGQDNLPIAGNCAYCLMPMQ
jgi:hypothetical protein